MKWIKIVLLGIFLSGATLYAGSGEDQIDNACQTEELNYQDGEWLKYKLYYNQAFIWIGAGRAEFSVEEDYLDGNPIHRVVATGRTLRTFDLFYKVRDRFETCVDPYSNKPVQFKRDILQGSLTMDHSYSFNHAEEDAYIHHMIKRDKMRRENDTTDITACTYDILSAVYYARNIDYSQFEHNDTVPLDLFLDGKLYPISFKYLGKETLETDIGKFRCIKISPQLVTGGIFGDDDNVVIYATDDENKLPIYLESALSFGKVKAYLQKYKGLKYDMEAKID